MEIASSTVLFPPHTHTSLYSNTLVLEVLYIVFSQILYDLLAGRFTRNT